MHFALQLLRLTMHRCSYWISLAGAGQLPLWLLETRSKIKAAMARALYGEVCDSPARYAPLKFTPACRLLFQRCRSKAPLFAPSFSCETCSDAATSPCATQRVLSLSLLAPLSKAFNACRRRCDRLSCEARGACRQRHGQRAGAGALNRSFPLLHSLALAGLPPLVCRLRSRAAAATVRRRRPNSKRLRRLLPGAAAAALM
jgi:hypothetical protein